MNCIAKHAFIYLAATGVAVAGTIEMTKLTGLTGGSPAETVVYRGDLTTDTPTFISSITIEDASFGFGGAPGQFSGFDLDAVKLAYSSADSASAAVDLPPLSIFDFTSSGVSIIPGTMRPPYDAKLFGTNVAGVAPDFSISTLGAFDANSSILVPGASGFLSLGDGGSITFNLTAPVLSTNLFLYVGEVEDEGEDLTVKSTPVPEGPAGTLFCMSLTVCILCRFARRFRLIPDTGKKA